MTRLSINNPAVSATLIALVLCTFGSGVTSIAVAQNPSAAPPASANPQSPDLINQLNLSPDQLDRIKAIGIEQQPERQAANKRIRLAEKSLDQAIYVENADDTVIAARARELADARSEIIRLQAVREARIRRVLTDQQLITFLELRRQVRNDIQRRRIDRNAQAGQGAPRTTLGAGDRAVQRRIDRNANRAQGRQNGNQNSSGFSNPTPKSNSTQPATNPQP